MRLWLFSVLESSKFQNFHQNRFIYAKNLFFWFFHFYRVFYFFNKSESSSFISLDWLNPNSSFSLFPFFSLFSLFPHFFLTFQKNRNVEIASFSRFRVVWPWEGGAFWRAFFHFQRRFLTFWGIFSLLEVFCTLKVFFPRL